MLDLYEETAIIFTADHGDMAGSHGMMSKGAYMYDEIYRIPLLVKAPGTPQPSRSAAFVHLMDVTATCLHVMAGAEQESMMGQSLHGKSLLPLVQGNREWEPGDALRRVSRRLVRSLFGAYGDRRPLEAGVESD